MSVLLLRLAGPMQSWGVQSRFSVRDTGLEPSKSGVVGLLCAALGRGREQSVDDLASLPMGARVDREGRLACDYHTALSVAKADGAAPATVVSRRYYLADAEFLVGLEGPAELLAGLDAALSAPVWPLYLGRRAFVPSVPVRLPDGLRPQARLAEILETYPWRPRHPRERRPERLRLVLDAEAGQGEPRPDVPLSFARRRFALRYVRTAWVSTVSEAPCS